MVLRFVKRSAVGNSKQYYRVAVYLAFCFTCGCTRSDDSLPDGPGAVMADNVDVQAVDSLAGPGSHAPITVEARGADFKWQFLTVGSDCRVATGDETVLGNELVLPPETLVTLVLTSTDYVYTLNVPDGRVAAAVPEMVHQIQFLTPESGRHEFRTDPMCGLRYFHDDVLGTMRITTNGDLSTSKVVK